jgi:hypothetical protein
LFRRFLDLFRVDHRESGGSFIALAAAGEAGTAGSKATCATETETDCREKDGDEEDADGSHTRKRVHGETTVVGGVLINVVWRHDLEEVDTDHNNPDELEEVE